MYGGQKIIGVYLLPRKLIKQESLLEIQGFKFSVAKVFNGGLSLIEQLKCIGIKEILKRSMIYQERRKFERWGRKEIEILTNHQNINVQTEWVESQVRAINPTCTTFKNDFALRSPFYRTLPWKYSGNYRVFCSAAYPAPFKGLHVAIRAVALLNKNMPNINLHIAGSLQNQGLRQNGYIAWLNREIIKLGISSNVNWLGPLSADRIVEELKICSAAVFPSYVESYCLALAESMMIGVPSIVGYTGGTSCLAHDGETALFFPPGDVAMCAHQIRRVLIDRELSEHLSHRAIEVAKKRSDPKKIVSRQLEIYNEIISKNDVE